jgi:hypothetical protein
MDGYLANVVEKLKIRKRKDWDIVGIIDGRERTGKSTFAQQLAISVDPNFTIHQITFTPQEFHTAVVNAKPGSCIIMDEGMTAFFSRASMSGTNIMLVRMLAECGQKNLIILICLPSFFVLDSYVALERCSFLVHVYVDKKGNRGPFKFYDAMRKKDLYLYGRQKYDYSVAKPNFRGKFTKAYVVSEEAYREKKRASLEHALATAGQNRFEAIYKKKFKVLILRCRQVHHDTRKILKQWGKDNNCPINNDDLNE